MVEWEPYKDVQAEYQDVENEAKQHSNEWGEWKDWSDEQFASQIALREHQIQLCDK